MKKILTYLFLFAVTGLYASPVNENRARQIASDFFSQTATRSSSTSLELEWAGSDIESLLSTRSVDDDPLIYIFSRGEANGFVIVSGDDTVAPILAYSYEETFDIDNLAPGLRYVISGWCRQIAATRGEMNSTLYSTENPYGNVVVSHETPLWGQSAPFNLNTLEIDGSMAVTGCVATAMSIIAYCNEWPEQGNGTIPGYTTPGGNQVSSVTLGHSYDYSNMLADYSQGYSSDQANAVAVLMGDMGKALSMQYGISESSAFGDDVPRAMGQYFGYSKSSYLAQAEGYPYTEWVDMLQENISSCGPTFYTGVDVTGGGHAFVLDGYTDADYFHINYGWEGYGNGYYLLPEQEYCLHQAAAFDMVPDRDGTSTYKDYLSLISLQLEGTIAYRGLQSDAASYSPETTFTCSIGGLYNTGHVIFDGCFALMLTDDEGVIKKELQQWPVVMDVESYIYDEFDITIPSDVTIESGDRLRLYYKGKHSSDEWIWARSYDELCVDEIILSATASQVAESLGILYSKTDRQFSFMSELAIQYFVKDSSANVEAEGEVASYTEAEIDMSDYETGEYTITFASGGESYELVIVLP